MDVLLAHSTNSEGKQQTLKEHSLNVADLAREFASPFKEADAASTAGLLHDLGKAKASWQERLAKLEAGEDPEFDEVLHDHKLTGATYAWSKDLIDQALIIAGHHGGIPDLSELQQVVSSGVHQSGMLEATGKIDFLKTLKPVGLTSADFYRISLLFSALVDADSIDTGDHFRSRLDVPFEPASMVALFDSLAAHKVSDAGASPRTLQLRKDVRQAAIEGLAKPQGFFQLHSVTGSGKTISGMLFATGHAVHHDMRRIVYVAPFRSIIDQSAEVYKRILSDENVLAHHSSSDLWIAKGEAAHLQRQLAENWDIPIVVTTAEQFFESFYRSKPSSSRKLHNVVNSVIIIDEVQALPLRLLTPCFALLRKLVEEYGCTVLFMTATMPPLRHPALLGKVRVTQVLKQKHSEHRRVRVNRSLFKHAYWFQVADFMSRQRQVCLITNTKSNAYRTFDKLPKASRIYLSTWMCPEHRMAQIKEVSNRLKTARDVHLASTQVIEAGVDFDFPILLREKAPLDSMLQAFGRCNRNGVGNGQCYIVSPVEGNKLDDYDAGIAIVDKLIFDQKRNLHDPATMRVYYKLLYEKKNLDTNNVMQNVDKLNFKTIREGSEDGTTTGFRLIREDQIHLIVRYGSELGEWDKAIEAIRGGLATKQKTENYRWAIRQVQRYVVSVYESTMKQLQREYPFALEALFLNYYVWSGEYDNSVGLGNIMSKLSQTRVDS